MKRVKKETPKAREAFEVYLKLGPERSLAAVARERGVGLSTVKYWSARNHWDERVLEHAEAIAEAEREGAREAAKSGVKEEAAQWKERQEVHRREEWVLREKLLELAREATRRWYECDDKPPTLESIAKLLELASKLGRLASGLGTERTELTGPDGGVLQVEIRTALARVYGAAAEAPPVDVEATVVAVEGKE